MKHSILVVVALLAQLIAQQSSSAQPLEMSRSLSIELEWSAGHEGSDVFLDEPRIALLSSDGLAFLVEKGRTSIRRFDHAGNELGPLGSVGSGPGEFSRIVSMIDVAPDSVLVYDIVNGQISVFSGRGQFVRSVSAGLLGGKAVYLLHANTQSMEWIAAYQPASLWGEPGPLIHQYRQDQDEITSSVVHPRQVADLTNPLHSFRANSSGAFLAAWVQSVTTKPFVVTAPDLYSGSVVAVAIEKNSFGQTKNLTVPPAFRPDPGFVIEGPSQAPAGTKGRILTLHLAGIGKQSAVVQVWNTQVVPLLNGHFGIAFAHAVDQPQQTYVDVFSVDEGFRERVRLDLDSELGNSVRVWDADLSGRLLISFFDLEGNPVLARTIPLDL